MFVHIPKTGGSTINEHLAQLGRVTLRFSGTPPAFRCPPQHLDAESLKAIIPINQVHLIFSVVRHPEDRLVSDFLSRIKRSKYRRLVEQLESRVGNVDLLSLYFEAWARAAMRKCKADQFYLGNHIRPQSDFLINKNHKIFYFEDGLDPVKHYLANYLHIDIDEFGDFKRNFSNFRIIKVSKRLSIKIERFFALDYENFNYAKRSIARQR